MRAEQPVLGSIFLIIAGIIAYLFNLLDRRNEELIHIAEDNLRELERDIIFAGFKRTVDTSRRRKGFWGSVIKNEEERQLGIFLRDDSDPKSKWEHGRWIPTIQYVIALSFCILGLCIFVKEICEKCPKYLCQ
jgi:hypothetical protein